ncbi:hypothetical protein IC620_00280 [Hazenella sp. IB182357]|uniref:Membrane protein YkvI n=1 Tax=Polycladospora coralii TaxID=2771432 RepID=A0A926N5E9_9BACL|nr:hypothetical protein [Polycladospora coralii]MBD1370796.1 hypothetical protein [Polycladospora coralii]
MTNRWMNSLKIGFTYIGTVVGAGFASGQEILQFFSLFGWWGTIGIMVSTVLFIWLGTRMMLMGHLLQAKSYEEVNHYLFGERIGHWVSIFVGITLFGVTTAMMAGTGALFEEQIGLSFHVGVIGTAVLAYMVIIRGMEGILSINALVVPLMLLFMLLIGIHSWQTRDFSQLAQLEPSNHTGNWLFSALTYVAFNLAMSQAVLVPLGAEISDKNTIRIGGWIGGVGLGLMLLIGHIAMQLRLDQMITLDIPMALVIEVLGEGIKMFFLLVMWGEVFTTLIGNVYGLAANLESAVPVGKKRLMALIFICAYAFSLLGFPTLVSYLYPLFGYCGMFIIALLIVRKLPA